MLLVLALVLATKPVTPGSASATAPRSSKGESSAPLAPRSESGIVRTGGYDKTTWGMSLAQVQALYPGGFVEHHQSGANSYAVVRVVAGIDPAFINFEFDPDGQLGGVTILFPQAATDVDLKTGTYTVPNNVESDSKWAVLKVSLQAKYGVPVLQRDDEHVSWLTAANDVVSMLFLVADPDHKTVGISYSPMGAPALAGSNTQGL